MKGNSGFSPVKSQKKEYIAFMHSASLGRLLDLYKFRSQC